MGASPDPKKIEAKLVEIASYPIWVWGCSKEFGGTWHGWNLGSGLAQERVIGAVFTIAFQLARRLALFAPLPLL